MADEVKVTPEVKPVVEPTPVEPTPTPAEEKYTKTEILRDLSKDLGVNLFEADGLKQVKTLIDSQKTEQQKLQEEVNAYQQKEAEWQKQQAQTMAQLEATKLGIAPTAIGDALKLADNDPNKLAEVVKKYPNFLTKGKVQFGVPTPSQFQNPTGKSEQEEYMQSNPMYRKYYGE